jgi:ATP-dependent Lon protease
MEEHKKIYPLLPLRDIVVFPHMVVPLFVGRDKSIAALEAALSFDRLIFLSSQTDPSTNDPVEDDIHRIGTISHIIQMLKLPDNTVKVLVEGRQRGRILHYLPNDRYFQVTVEENSPPVFTGPKAEAMVRNVVSSFEGFTKMSKKVPQDLVEQVISITDASRLADTLAAQLPLKIADRQAVLEIDSVGERLEKLLMLMESEIEVLEIEKKIRGRVKKQMEKSQREFYLNEQMRAIQKELGHGEEGRTELDELDEKIKSRGMGKEALQKAQKELKKLKMMSPMSAEATVSRNYIDWLVSIPWQERTEDKLDITEAETVLDEDHYGLEKVKERILEYLAVRKLVSKLKGPILCFVGPPGVGKTSLARSIARAMGRKFVRMSLGGVRDEAEIRGHRRTYIGALPGKIMQQMKKAGTVNPVFLLDEVDKMSTRPPPCWRSSTRSRTTPSTTTTSTWTTTFRTSCSSPRRTCCTGSRCRSRTGWRSSACRGTRSWKSCISPRDTWSRRRSRSTGFRRTRWSSATSRSSRSSGTTPGRPGSAASSGKSPPSAGRSPGKS